jgi:hypothetical protein
VLERQAPITAQVGMWWLYFRWQWLRDWEGQHPGAQAMLAAFFLLLGLLGGWVHWQRDRRSFWFFGPLMFTMTLLLIYYLNFKYGYSQAPELGETVPREVRDRDYFYLWSFSAWSVWAALGLVFVWETIAAAIGAQAVKVGKQVMRLPTQKSWLSASPVLLVAFVPLFGNWEASTRHAETDTRDFAHDLLESVEPYGILVTVGDNDTFPLWYAQEVEGIRRDVVIANTSLLNTDWYVRQIIRAPIREYDAANGPAIYRGKTWTKPTVPPLRMTMDDADKIPLAYDMQQPLVFKAGDIEATIQPHTLTKADIVVLQMIKDNTGRPVYFSRTSGGYGQELGLGAYLLTQGLARKLMPQVPTPGKDTVLVQGEGFVDVPRTTELWTKVFEAPKSIIAKDKWIDKPSVGIPALYISTGFLLSDLLHRGGNTQLASQVMHTTQQIAKATRLSDLFASEPEIAPTSPGDSPRAVPLPVTPPETARKK